MPGLPLLRLILPLSLLLSLVGCMGDAEEAGHGHGHGAMPPPPVATLLITPADLPVVREYTGFTAGSREVEVRARVSGILKLRSYNEGAEVKAGELLFAIDDAPYRAQLAAAEAQLAQANAELVRSEREVKRLQPLVASNATSRKNLDDAEAELALAKAGVQAAAAAVSSARLNLDYTQVTAPINGITGTAHVVEGTLVAAGDTLLTTLTQIDPLHVQFAVGENQWLAQQRDVAEGRLKVPADNELEVRIKLADGQQLARIGRIDFQSARIDGQTGSVALRAILPNPGGELKAGQFVRAQVSGALRPQAISVPQSAVLEGPSGKFVYVVAKGEQGQTIAEQRPIRVGEWITVSDGAAGRQWLVHSGLKAGDQLILDNLIKLGPGAPVTVLQPEQTPTTVTVEGH